MKYILIILSILFLSCNNSTPNAAVLDTNTTFDVRDVDEVDTTPMVKMDTGDLVNGVYINHKTLTARFDTSEMEIRGDTLTIKPKKKHKRKIWDYECGRPEWILGKPGDTLILK